MSGGATFRVSAAVMGVVVLAVHTAVAVAGVVALAWLLANPPGLLTVALALVVGVAVAAYVAYRAGTVRLVASLEARPLPRDGAPDLHRRLDRLGAAMDVDRPTLLVADLGAPNALSLGGPRAGRVVLDRSLLDLLTVDELEGILAHELAHVEGYDTLLNTLGVTAARTLVGVLFLPLFPLAVFLAGLDRAAGWFAGRPGAGLGLLALFRRAVVAAIGGVLVVFTLAFLAYSRRQEYAADRRAADVTGRPGALARALVKVHRANSPRSGLLSMLYIHDERREGDALLSTHPPLERRVDRLVERDDSAGARHRAGRLEL